MKIPASIRDLYTDARANAEHLKLKVDDLIRGRKRPEWHYVSRVKGEESFALKVESGRFDDPANLEDSFACTLVVENRRFIKEAEDIVKSLFSLDYRRPICDRFTHKSPDAFPFDDLRLYVRWKDDQTQQPTGLDGRLFEVQIKTFLQHAWGIATHDMIYKANETSWPKRRIAAEVKAMLEHAEVSIEFAETIAAGSSLKRTDKSTMNLEAVLRCLNGLWDRSRLPDDMLRLADNTTQLAHALEISIPDLQKILKEETEAGQCAKLLNLSPYAAIVQTLVNRVPDTVRRFVEAKGDHSRFRLVIPKEVQLPDSMDDLKSERLLRI